LIDDGHKVMQHNMQTFLKWHRRGHKICWEQYFYLHKLWTYGRGDRYNVGGLTQCNTE